MPDARNLDQVQALLHALRRNEPGDLPLAVVVEGQTVDEEVRRQLVAQVEGVMADVPGVDQVRGRWRVTERGAQPVDLGTGEDLARQVFPNGPWPEREHHVYGRWEDAMIAQVAVHEFTTSYDGRAYHDSFQQSMDAQHPPDAQLPPGFLHGVSLRTLSEAEPVYVAEEMCDLVDHARHSFEVEPVRPSEPFVPSGFCLLAKPLALHDAPWIPEESGRSLDGKTMIRAISWIAMHSEDLSSGSFWITLYNDFLDDDGHHVWMAANRHELRRRYKGTLVLGHAFQWEWGTAPTPETMAAIARPGEDDDNALFRANEQAALVQTLWRLGSQFVPVKARAPRGLRRDAQRRTERAYPDTNVVLLRRLREYEPPEEESGRHVAVSFVVRGYWARRHAREGTRQVWVRPHVKGQGPFKATPERAWEFRR